LAIEKPALSVSFYSDISDFEINLELELYCHCTSLASVSLA